jgi:hypothetical protein
LRVLIKDSIPQEPGILFLLIPGNGRHDRADVFYRGIYPVQSTPIEQDDLSGPGDNLILFYKKPASEMNPDQVHSWDPISVMSFYKVP